MILMVMCTGSVIKRSKHCEWTNIIIFIYVYVSVESQCLIIYIDMQSIIAGDSLSCTASITYSTKKYTYL